jgi:hypothetical protein
MIKKMYLMIIIIVSLIYQSLFAQPDTLWTKIYGGSESDMGNSGQQTLDGGYIIAGTTASFGAGSNDVWLIKTDASGDTLWTRTIGGLKSDGANSVRQTADGGYVITGPTTSFGAESSDVWLIKTDASGDTIWTKIFRGSNNDSSNEIQQTSDNGYILTGSTSSYGAGGFDIWLIKTDASGDTLWTKTIGGSNHELGTSIQQTLDDGYIIAGSTGSFGAGLEDGWLIKTNASGDTLWTKTFGGSELDRIWSIQQTDDQGFIMTGFTSSYGAGLKDVWLIKTDASGDTLWTKTFGGSKDEWGYYVLQTDDGGYIISGYTNSFGAGLDDIWIIKTDAAGDTLWTKIFGGSEEEDSQTIYQTTDRGYLIIGNTKSYGNGNNDVWLIRIAPDVPNTVTENRSDVPELYKLSQNYPNPFNLETCIRFKLPVENIVILKIYDMLGQKVRTLLEEKRTSGYHLVHWNGRNDVGELVPSSVYLYEFITSGFRQMNKMLLLK